MEFVVQQVEQCGGILPKRPGIASEGFSHSANIEGKRVASGDTATVDV